MALEGHILEVMATSVAAVCDEFVAHVSKMNILLQIIRMRFVTVATQSDGYFEYLIQSCKRNNIQLDVLGWGMKWSGWVWRIDLVREYLESLCKNEIVCFIDAYDVIMLHDSSVIEKRFLNSYARIVVAQDLNVSFFKEAVARFKFGICKRVRINAGTYIGYVSDILWMINAMCTLNDCSIDRKLDDQKMMTQLCGLLPDLFKIDTSRSIFLCISYHGDMCKSGITVTDKKRLLYKGAVDPCILHGAGKANLDGVISSLGYNIILNSKITQFHVKKKHCLYSSIAIVVIIVFVAVVLLSKNRVKLSFKGKSVMF